jgi:ABC-2 type transport system ATP-binding protein
LHGVSFEVEPGAIFGYLGPNGAGKTTTLRIALGLVRPSAGAVRIFGTLPGDPKSRSQIGFLPGDLHLYGDLVASRLLEWFARFRPHQPPRLRNELIDRLSLDSSALTRRVKFLSHGTRQKLGLIIAMQHDPQLLLLDEPSNGLDPLVQQAFRALIVDAAGRGRSVLFSSHLLNEVQAVCSRVAILRAGELVALESIEKLRANVVRRLSVQFHGQVPPGLLELPQVARAQVDGHRATLWVRGDLDPLLGALANGGVRELVFPEAELEDIFLSYYRESAPHA